MSPSKLDCGGESSIIDIRQGLSTFDPVEEVTRSLRGHSLPSLLLWDDKGQEWFDQLSQTPTYYLFHGEIEILRLHGASMAATVPANGMLLELGCGAIHKTQLILSILRKQQKPIQYFALDVSRDSLNDSVQKLKKAFQDCKFITITGLLGTYDDGVAWLSELQHQQANQSVTIMWLGNSMCNMESQGQASDFLARFRTACEQAQLACRFIVSTDICQEDSKIHAAYNTPEVRRFLFNALQATNQHLGSNVFSYADWTIFNWLDDFDHTLHLNMTPSRDVSIPLRSPGNDNAESVVIRKGQLLYMVSSGKWSEEAIGRIAGQAGFHVQQCWKDGAGDYGEHTRHFQASESPG
ncbi:histidine-specific methyltransferase [Xylaria intraflava]|nr:histidine-specific methyltransferase [Xylaria intraflava]